MKSFVSLSVMMDGSSGFTVVVFDILKTSLQVLVSFKVCVDQSTAIPMGLPLYVT